MRRPYERGDCLVPSRMSFPTFRLNCLSEVSVADVGLRFANPTYGFANNANISKDGAKKWAPVTACV